jgi:hypothetical protein
MPPCPLPISAHSGGPGDAGAERTDGLWSGTSVDGNDVPRCREGSGEDQQLGPCQEKESGSGAGHDESND